MGSGRLIKPDFRPLACLFLALVSPIVVSTGSCGGGKETGKGRGTSLRERYEFSRNIISHVRRRRIWTRRKFDQATIMPYDTLPSVSLTLTDGSVMKIPGAKSSDRTEDIPPVFFLVMCSEASMLSNNICTRPQADYISDAPPNAKFIFMSYGPCWIPQYLCPVNKTSTQCENDENPLVSHFHRQHWPSDGINKPCFTEDQRKSIVAIQKSQLSNLSPDAKNFAERNIKFAINHPALMENALGSRLVSRPTWSDEVLRVIFTTPGSFSGMGRNEESIEELPDERQDKKGSQAVSPKTPQEVLSFSSYHGPHHRKRPVSKSRKSYHHNRKELMGAKAAPLFSCETETYHSLARRFPSNTPLAMMGLGCGKSDFEQDVKGKIAVILRGMCKFEEKLETAKRKGAIAAVVISTECQIPVAMSYRNAKNCEGKQDFIPAIMISHQDGQSIVAKVRSGKPVTPKLEVGMRGPIFLGIDASSRVRTVGSFTEPTLRDAVAELVHYNYEYQAKANLSKLNSESIPVFTPGEYHLGESVENVMTVTENMGKAAALSAEMTLECRERLRQNCGEWDQILNLHVRSANPKNPYPSKDKPPSEMFGPLIARWVTPYSSEGYWITDLTPMLPLIVQNGPQVIFHLTTVDGIRIDHNISLILHYSASPLPLKLPANSAINDHQPDSENESNINKSSKSAHHKRQTSRRRKSARSHHKHHTSGLRHHHVSALLETELHSNLSRPSQHHPRKHHGSRHSYSGSSPSKKTRHGLCIPRPLLALPLFTGGDFSGFNSPPNIRNATLKIANRGDGAATVSFGLAGSDVKEIGKLGGGISRVEIVSLVSGHGWGVDAYNCAEFCDHEHRVWIRTTMGIEQTTSLSFPTSGSNSGCEEYVSRGVTPNQYGTWPTGRSGWCPGLDVPAWRVFVPLTESGDSGSDDIEVEIGYSALFEGFDYVYKPKTLNSNGFPAKIHLDSYLVMYAKKC
ncbi:hypothetical protein AAMO2058_001070400 [Amorphochlora amoebiformis]